MSQTPRAHLAAAASPGNHLAKLVFPVRDVILQKVLAKMKHLFLNKVKSGQQFQHRNVSSIS